MELTKEQAKAFRKSYIGREAEVLLEEPREIGGRNWLTGYTKDYVKAAVAAKGNKVNTLVKVPIKGFLTDEILR